MIENLLAGIPHTVVYLDDILITGVTEEEHRANVRDVLIAFYIAPYSTEIALRRLTFKTQLKHILSSYKSNTFHTQ